MSILSVDNISPIGSGTSVTVNSAATLVLTNANSTGVITATSFSGSTATFSGQITANDTINLASAKKLSMAGDVFKIYHSTNAAIINESGDLIINQNVSNKDIKISTGSGPTERLRITSGGQVNIGTGELTQTARKLNVYGGATRVTQTSGGNTVEVFGHTTSGQSYGLLVNAGSTSGDYCANFRNSSGTTLFRIRGDGKIGIGVDSPDGLLEVYNSSVSGNTVLKIHNDKTGDAANITIEGKRTSDNDTGQVLFKNNNYSVAGVFANAGGSGNHDNGYLKFFTSPVGSGNVLTERLRIGSDGEVSLRRGGISATPSLEIYGSGNASDTVADNLRFHNWGNSSGDYWDVGVNHGLDGSGNNSKPSTTLKGAAIRFNAKNGAVTLITSPSSTSTQYEGLTQNETGYVNIPHQPSFHARRVSNANSTTNPLVYDSVPHNNGSHYKSSGTDQGKFVAPVSGVYLFYWTAIKTNNGSVCRLYINVNNSHIYSNMHLRLQETGTYSNGSMQAIVNLSSGDKVHISLEAGNIHGNEYTHFGGYLIH